jgi:hypothetical protein
MKNKKTIIIICAIVTLLIAGISYFILRGKDDSDNVSSQRALGTHTDAAENSSMISYDNDVDETEYEDNAEILDDEEIVEDDSDDDALDFDFSEFAGTYKATEFTNDAYGGGQSLDNLVLDKDGIVSGGGAYFHPNPFPVKAPTSVEIYEDGSYKCIVNEEIALSGDVFYIYPVGVVEERFKDDEVLVNSVYIRYYHVDGGVCDEVFYKVEETE